MFPSHRGKHLFINITDLQCKPQTLSKITSHSGYKARSKFHLTQDIKFLCFVDRAS